MLCFFEIQPIETRKKGRRTCTWVNGTLILASDLDPIVVYRGVNSYAVDIIKWRMHDGLLQVRMKEKNKSHASYKRVYIANWVIIYHLPPIKGSGNSC